MQKAAAPLLIIVILIALYAVFAQYKNANQPPQTVSAPHMQPMSKPGMKAGSGPMGGGGETAMAFGDKKAKVVVDAIVPTDVECHAKTIELLREFADKNPTKVCVNIYDLHSSSGMTAKGKFGVSCASVIVNGKQEFDINDAGKSKHVYFSKKPNEASSSYSSEDVVAVLKDEVKKAYGEKG